ncbi:sulfatase-like hydrolase/transferase [Singulisphaera sp. PoT]|uniref:sulfatase-like hydrolase/transferase n=1 Tax=Singulisphaera sp. PoT TaxID=3411797 RepID=UPI003BF4A546
MADDLGWADLSVYGSRFHRTPRIDKLAGEGKRFTQAYAASPVCSPTRAALITGSHPARLHLTDWLPGRPDSPAQRLARPQILQQLPIEERTISQVFKRRGYATASIGKWHLGGAGFDPKAQGFDMNVAGDAKGSPLSYFSPYERGGQTIPGLENAPDQEYLTDRLTTEAERFIEAHAKGPFFLYMPHFAVHTPLVAKRELVQHYAEWDGTPHGRQENPIYAAMLESLDASVGRVLDCLDRLKLTSETIVIFTSDNGGLATVEGPHTPATINAPLREGKGWLYEGGIRVPLIVKWPEKIQAGIESTPVWSGDLAPTLATLCGLDPFTGSDGVSLVGLLTQGEALKPRPLYWHYPHYSNQGGRPGGAIRVGKWKLIEFYETGRRELFDLERDPGESTNLSDVSPERVEELGSQLKAWRDGVKAQTPAPNPDYSPNRQKDDGNIVLPASTAEIHGIMLRYEPLPHKNTLGYWVRADDWASWEFDAIRPGDYELEALVGCGTGSGGSSVEFRLGDQVLKLTVPETGGFQKFQSQNIGRLSIPKAGRYQLEVRAIAKPGVAVMDLRTVRLRPIESK